MKLLHTSDWHVGKTIRGHSRADEHRAVLAEIAGIAEREAVDLILIGGDLFETAAPTAESEAIVYRALLDLARTGAPVAIISGNHDNARRLQAVAPVFEALGEIHVLTRASSPADGGVRRFTVRTGEDVVLAMLPFVSKRGIVRAAELWDNEAFESSALYTDRVTRMLELLAREFRSDAINLLMAHTFVHGGQLGGGERQAHFLEEYAITAQSLPITANYIALGHVHRAQKIATGSPTHYCGSPLQLDFGEQDQRKQVNLVDLTVGAPGVVTPMPLESGRRLVTLSGSLDAVVAAAAALDDEPWIRVRLDQQGRAGLADDVRKAIGDNVVDVIVQSRRPATGANPTAGRLGRSHTELFDEYLAHEGIDDPRLSVAFRALLDHELDEQAQR